MNLPPATDQHSQNASDRYHTVLNSLDAGFCIIGMRFDADGTPADYQFLEVNAAFEKQTGIENATGRWIRDILPEHEQYWFDLYGRIALTGEPMRFENAADQLNRFYDVYAFRVDDPDQHHVAVLFNDISARRQVEKALMERERLLDLLLHVSDSARALADEGDIAREACRLVKNALGSSSCSYGFFDIEHGKVHTIADISDTAEGVPNTEGSWNLGALGHDIIAMHQRGEPVMIEDTATHPATAAFQEVVYAPILTRAFLSVPLIKNGELLAYFTVHDRVPRRYTQAETALLRDVAARIWEAIQRARAARELQATETRQAMQLKLVQQQRETDDPNTIMTLAAEALGRHLGVNRVGFFDTPNDDTILFTASWTDGTLPALAGSFPTRGMAADYLAELHAGHTLVINDTAQHPLTANSSFAAVGVCAMIDVPLIRNGRWCAGFYVNHSFTRQWTHDEAMLARNIGEQTWDAVERAQAVAALRASEERLQMLYAQEQAARGRAEEASRLKDEFLATVSHELRTPLTSFMGYAQLLLRRTHDAEYVNRTVDKMMRSAKAQAQLIEDLLDVSRIVSGKLRFQLDQIDLARVAQAAIDTLMPAVEAKSIRLHSDLPTGVGLILGDADRLQQVAWNLLSNAAKFTPAGGTISVRLAAENGAAQLAIADSGMGISADFLPFVFDRFRQADGTSNRAHGGLGLGLAIVRNIVEMHGGTVSVDSAGADQGATFTVRLPLGDSERLPAGDEAARTSGQAMRYPPELRGARILLVDDQADILDMLGEVLGDCGAELRLCANARDALDLVRSWQPAALVSDIAMPGEDGYWLIRAVRALPAEQGGGTPAVALTAYVRIEERVNVLAAGFNDYVPKPVETDVLLRALAQLLQAPAAG
jgi:signal transduction histidine kinase/CheY-like chemotaxis protein